MPVTEYAGHFRVALSGGMDNHMAADDHAAAALGKGLPAGVQGWQGKSLLVINHAFCCCRADDAVWQGYRSDRTWCKK
jgi:hypothetical protein